MESDRKKDTEEANHAMNRPQDIRKRQTEGIEEAATTPASGAAINHAEAGAALAGGDGSEGGETEDSLQRAVKRR